MASGLLLQAQRSVTGTRGDGGRVTTIAYRSDGTSAFTPGISERKSSATRMMHGDYLGSIVRQTGSAGTSQYGARYDAFGATYATSGTQWGPFGFAGQWGYQTDADSGLMLLGHRYYDSSTGRFLSRDPIKNGRNWYGYCGNNPLKWVDPTGNITVGGVLIVAVVVWGLYELGKWLIDQWKNWTIAGIWAQHRKDIREMVEGTDFAGTDQFQQIDYYDRGDSAVAGGGAAWSAGMNINVKAWSIAGSVAGGGSGMPLPPPRTEVELGKTVVENMVESAVTGAYQDYYDQEVGGRR